MHADWTVHRRDSLDTSLALGDLRELISSPPLHRRHGQTFCLSASLFSLVKPSRKPARCGGGTKWMLCVRELGLRLLNPTLPCGYKGTAIMKEAGDPGTKSGLKASDLSVPETSPVCPTLQPGAPGASPPGRGSDEAMREMGRETCFWECGEKHFGKKPFSDWTDKVMI
ncbi:uncharacterized protein LOC143643770 [Tamandua tetradactyla]|uniref:uncharacterized protein LOC143643770 n=1 Tax=Tamandua tetradactyla TaxID=48850 RepID=UPI004053B0AA